MNPFDGGPIDHAAQARQDILSGHTPGHAARPRRTHAQAVALALVLALMPYPSRYTRRKAFRVTGAEAGQARLLHFARLSSRLNDRDYAVGAGA